MNSQSNRLRSLVLTLGLLSVHAPSVHANVGEAYGFGSRSAALAGTGVTQTDGGYLSYSNPAALGVRSDKRLSISYGFLLMDPQFLPITGVVTENKYTSDKSAAVVGDVDTSYRVTLGQELGLSYHLFPELSNFSFGLTTFLPFDPTASIDSGEAFQPEYVLYRSRTQRPQFEIGFGGDLGAGFHLGLGVHVGFGLTSNARVLLQGDSTKPSSMRLASTLKPKAGPYLGLQYYVPAAPVILGLVVRAPVSSPNTMILSSGARVFGGISSLDFNLNAVSTLFYDPLAIEVGATISESSFGATTLQLDYQAWSGFQAPALSIEQPTTTQCQGSCGIVISPSANPSYVYQDIVIPRIGQEIELSRSTTLRLGYYFRPSIFSRLPTGAGNYLDPPKHAFSAGLGFQFRKFLNFNTPSTLDLHGSYQALVTEHVTKTAGNEGGDQSDRKVGDPGYDAGGKILGGGLTLSLAF